MDSLLTVSFEAHNADRNHHRRYEIRLGRDLFGEWTVSLLYGRTGRDGHEVQHAGSDAGSGGDDSSRKCQTVKATNRA